MIQPPLPGGRGDVLFFWFGGWSRGLGCLGMQSGLYLNKMVSGLPQAPPATKVLKSTTGGGGGSPPTNASEQLIWQRNRTDLAERATVTQQVTTHYSRLPTTTLYTIFLTVHDSQKL